MFSPIPRSTFRASRSPNVITFQGAHVFYLTPTSSGSSHQSRTLFTKLKRKQSRSKMAHISRTMVTGVISLLVGGSVLYILYENDFLQPLPPTRLRSDLKVDRQRLQAMQARRDRTIAQSTRDQSALSHEEVNGPRNGSDDQSAWTSFTNKFDTLTSFTESFSDIKWASISGSISDLIVPEWAKLMPEYVNKLKRELSMAPGSLADEIWQEAHDPYLNPEIEKSAAVRVSDEICNEEKDFLVRRRKITTTALAKYLGLPEEEVHPEDVPCIAMVGSGGGLRALIAGSGSFLATTEAGLFNCVTYTAGVSGSCWLQALYHSSLGGRRLDKLVDHLKARIGTHFASPIIALGALTSAPTNKFLLRGFVEKLKGDPNADFGIVDVYGVLLAARFLVPKGELEVNDDDLKISNQQRHLEHGENPLPIYCAVRHEIPITEDSSPVEKATKTPSESTKEKARSESWFQWFEMTPYEFFCEEFNAGIPTWAVGRKFMEGQDVPQEDGSRVPEIRLPLLLGIFGSAFCATLEHYYREIRPMIKGLTGFSGIDEMVQGRNDDLSKVHPIDPASIPNPFAGMRDKLPETTPESISKSEHLQLMDAGMSNNLPIYPLLRPGRAVDVIIAFDASADVKTENWLSVTDGYAKQRGIKGWPIGTGWPKEFDTAEKTAGQLDEAQAVTTDEADRKVEEAKAAQLDHLSRLTQQSNKNSTKQEEEGNNVGPGDLGYCTVWVGTTQEREHTDTSTAPLSKSVAEDWQLMEPDAGIAVIYFPFLSNPKVKNVNPETAPYMSTWNFIYTHEDIDNTVKLARANFEEGAERTRKTIRAVYERKKRLREEMEAAQQRERFRRKMRLGIIGKNGDHFS